jgi:hypothetical protein
VAIISGGIYVLVRRLLDDGVGRYTKRVRKSLIQAGHWNERRIELEIVTLLCAKAQSMDVIFDFLALYGFLTATDKVSFYPTDETRQ